MKASELRIGNWVMNDYLHKPQQVYPRMIGQLHEAQSNGGSGGMSGLPLTEEWLLKFGFDKGQLGRFRFINEHFSLVIDGFEFDYNGIFVGQIQYVHQLQNLYFALTGEELTIKP